MYSVEESNIRKPPSLTFKSRSHFDRAEHAIYYSDYKSDSCNAYTDNSIEDPIVSVSNRIITEGKLSLFSFSDQNHYYKLCLNWGFYFHSIKLNSYSKSAKLACDLYVSATEPYPSSTSWDYKSTESFKNNSLYLHSYLPELKQSRGTLFIAVNRRLVHLTGFKIIDPCHLEVEIGKVENDQLLNKLGLFENGKVLLPRDLHEITKII